VRRFLVVTSTETFKRQPHIHAKILTAALLISNGVRQDAEAVFYLVDVDRAVKVVGARVKRLYPDEESAAGFLKKAILGKPLPGVVVKSGVRELALGALLGPEGPQQCLPKPPFTYLVKLQEYNISPHCGLGLGNLPPHHQVAVVNIAADRLLYGRRPWP